MGPIILLTAAVLQGAPTASSASAIQKSGTASSFGPVTSAYLRSEAPELILAMAEGASAGRLDRSILECAAGRKTAMAILKSMNGLPATRRASTALPGTKKLKRVGSWSAALNNLGIDRLVEYEPSQLSFPKLHEGQSSVKMLLLTCPASGFVTAALPTDLNFEIVRMSVYDGTVEVDGSRPSLPPKPKIIASRTAAPWRLVAKSGQSLGVFVRFKPLFHLFKNGAGLKSSVISLVVPSRMPTAGQSNMKLAIPIKGHFAGKSLGFIAYPDRSEIDVMTPNGYKPDVSQEVLAPLVVSSTIEPITLNIAPLKIPEGMSMNPVTISLAKGETRKVNVPLRLARKKPGIWGTYETPFDITLRISSSKRTVEVGFFVILYPISHVWNISESVGSCDVGAQFTIYNTGQFVFSGWAANNDIIASRNVSFRGGFNGQDLINMVVVAPANDTGMNSYGFVRQYYKDNFAGLIQQKLSYTIKVQQGT